MAIPSVITAAQLEHRIHPRLGLPVPEVQQPPEPEDVASPSARQMESVPLAVLNRVAQFIAHDFCHHLSTVYANAEFLGSRNMESIDKEELLGEIHTAIDCMTDQLDSLLLFTRTGRKIHPRHQSLRHIIEQVIQMVRAHPQTRHVKVTRHDMPSLEGCMDGMKMRSAIFNLLLNACQAAKLTPEVKAVDIDLHQDSYYVFVRVSDAGPGVPRAIQDNLFQPFVKAKDTNGMGLGLTIARCIAQEHGGEVYLEESRPGRTVFVLTLPKGIFAVS